MERGGRVTRTGKKKKNTFKSGWTKKGFLKKGSLL